MADDDCIVREVELGDRTLKIKEFTLLQDEAGAVVWDAGLVLSYYLAHQHREGQPLVAGRTCLELGSGTGVVGLTAAVLGAAQVYLTDLPHLVPYMRENIQLNGLGATCSALPLEWGNVAHLQVARASVLRRSPEVLLAADVVYTAAARQSLFQTLDDIMAPLASGNSDAAAAAAAALQGGNGGPSGEGGQGAEGGEAEAVAAERQGGGGDGGGSARGGGNCYTEVFLSYEQRPGVEELPELCDRHGLVAEQVAEEDLHPCWRSPDIRVLRLRRKAVRDAREAALDANQTREEKGAAWKRSGRS